MTDLTTAPPAGDVLIVGAASETVPCMTREEILALECGPEELEELRQTTDPARRDELIAAIQADFAATVAPVIERGRVCLDFGPGNHGDVNAFDNVTKEPVAFYAHGRVEVSEYVELSYAELAMLPADLAGTLPLDCFETVELLGADDELLRALARNPRTTSLVITAVIDEEFAGRHKAVVEESAVRAGGSLISDEAFAELGRCTGLSAVRVQGTLASDATVAAVAGALPKLTMLEVSGPNLTGSFLSQIPAETELTYLGVAGESVTGTALSTLRGLEHVLAASFGGPHSLDGLDTAAFFAALPALTDLRWDGGDGDDLTRLLPLHAGRPGLSINGMSLSEKAITRVLRKSAQAN